MNWKQSINLEAVLALFLLVSGSLVSFGSCSSDRPIEDAETLRLINAELQLHELPRFLEDGEGGAEEKETGNNLRGKRGMHQRCGGIMGGECQPNLQCTRVPAGNICLPVKCIEEVFQQEMKEQNLENAAYEVLERAGLPATQDGIFNQTTMDRGRIALARDKGQYLMNDGVVEKLGKGIEGVHVDMDRIQARVEQECTNPENATTYAQDEMYWGLQLEANAGGKVMFHHLQQGPDATHVVCFGAGPALEVHFAFLFGIVFAADSRDDVNDCCFMADGGGTAGLGIGIAVGFTSPGCKTKLELTATAGIGAGFTLYGCFPADDWQPFPPVVEQNR